MSNSPAERRRIVAVLGTTQTIAWASSYYLPAVLVDPVSRDLGIPADGFLAAFSLALIASAVVAPKVGRMIDRAGGREVLSASNFVLAFGLVMLANAQGAVMLTAAWVILGIGMGMGTYDPAFATLTRIYGRDARGPITGITLIAGFASTVGWPITAALDAAFDWRTACLFWAATHIVLCLPLHALVLPKGTIAPTVSGPESAASSVPVTQVRTMVLLGIAFAAVSFVTGAMATHLPRILQSAGATTAQAIFFASLLGPAQVGARLAEFAVMKHVHPLAAARFAAALNPLGVLALSLLGPAGMAAFALLHGAGNGLLTIAKGTVPLALLGPVGFGHRLGLISAPGRALQAASPLLFGLLVTRYGADALWFAAALMLVACGAFLRLRRDH